MDPRTTRPARLARPAAGLLAALALLAGCGGETAVDAGSGDPGEGAPAAGDYVATGLPAPFAPGDEVRFTVRPGEVGFTAACNSFGGAAAWEGGVLRATDLGGTEMGCAPRLVEQDAWLADLVGGDPAYALDGDGFTLTGAGVEVSFVPASAGAAPLEGTTWTLDGFGEASTDGADGADGADGSMSSVPAGVTSTLRIADGRMTLEPGCNGRPQPAVEVGEDHLVVEGYAMTEMSCGDAADRVEAAVTAVVQGRVAYVVEGDGLTLTGTDGGVLTYRAG